MIDRALDANLNRAVEGLRVLEDCARFGLDDGGLAARAKSARHALRAAAPARLITGRDTAGDVGTTLKTATEDRRRGVMDLIRANAARVAEALRVIGEFGKVAEPALASVAEAQRYAVYDLERDLLQAWPVQRLWQERLYVLVDSGCTTEPLAVATAAAAAGAGIIQLRAKECDQRAYAALALQVQRAVRAAGALFIVNDHVAVAAAIGADGIHVGQDDLPVDLVRRVVGPACLIGLSCHSADQVAAACRGDADYLGLGPMYGTSTKPHEPVRGPDLLRGLPPLDRPSYAIGGIDAGRLDELLPLVPHGVAVAGAVCRASDVARVVGDLRRRLDPVSDDAG